MTWLARNPTRVNLVEKLEKLVETYVEENGLTERKA